MSGPDCDDGYTRIANELLDAIIRAGFGKREVAVLLYVIRKTYGWRKKSDEMSLSQISRATGIAVSHVSGTLKALKLRKVLLIQEGVSAQSVGINKNYLDWGVTKTVKGVTETVSYQNSNERVTKTVTKGLPKREPQKKDIKEKKESARKRTPKKNSRLDVQALVTRGVDKQHATDWLEIRKVKKAPLTATAWAAIEREAHKAGMTISDVVRVCAERGWQGFKAEWVGGDQSASNPYAVGTMQ